MPKFELSRATLKGKPIFEPFAVPELGTALGAAHLKPEEALLLMERKDAVKTFLLKQMVYHHIAQGEVKGEPYLISF